eukprot:TRINITY_DN8579_c0_g1_i1.p1 TRINITY_DN8579_c0_g1~~TRINITY_DN8579_c0_g1_i1.p1  ORF type:complete len:556 (-),score=111.60 TRINITY_DN8579_c0_g1_i1:866-2533(-)
MKQNSRSNNKAKHIIRTKGRNFKDHKEILIKKTNHVELENRKIINEIHLGRVIGFSSNFNALFHLYEDTHKKQDPILFYISGSIVVMHKLGESKQRMFISPKDNPLTALSVSSDLKYICAGERCAQPSIYVWEVRNKMIKSTLSEGTHNFGISCLKFAGENNEYIISSGYRNDKRINQWNWENQEVIACNTTSSKIYSISVGSNYFVTAGEKHLMVWSLDNENESNNFVSNNSNNNNNAPLLSPRLRQSEPSNQPMARRKTLIPTSNLQKVKPRSVPNNNFLINYDLSLPTKKSSKLQRTLEGRSATVGVDNKGLLFVDVKVLGNVFYCIAEEMIFLVGEERKVAHSKKIAENSQLLCLSHVKKSTIVVGGNDGLLILLDAKNFDVLVEFPKPQLKKSSIIEEEEEDLVNKKLIEMIYPDVIFCEFMKEGESLVTIYSDKTVICWDLSVGEEVIVNQVYSLSAHYENICELEMFSSKSFLIGQNNPSKDKPNKILSPEKKKTKRRRFLTKNKVSTCSLAVLLTTPSRSGSVSRATALRRSICFRTSTTLSRISSR